VKDLFLNHEIQNKTSLAAVNSINWARLMAQTVYYFWAYLQLEERKVNFIVPSGNFGNIFSARVAQNMGLPIKELHIVTNKNETLNKIISSGQMEVSNVKNTYSPSMDIQISSNFERQIFESVAKDSDVVKDIMSSFNENNEFIFESGMVKEFKNTYISSAISNDTTLNTIKKFKENYNYLSDPHTATGLSVLDSIQNIDHPYVSLACAHPAKFGQAIEKATGISPSFPIELDNIFDKNEKMTILPNNPEVIKSLIIKNI
jgi:threonine synthase